MNKQKRAFNKFIFIVASELCLMAAAMPSLYAADPNYPEWWIEKGVINANAASTNDYSPLVAGQLKWCIVNAYDEMTNLPNGAGAELTSYVNGFHDTHNYEMVNIGQLKHAASLFYNRFYEEHVNAYQYPWAGGTEAGGNYNAANIGQLKNLFSFNLRNLPKITAIYLDDNSRHRFPCDTANGFSRAVGVELWWAANPSFYGNLYFEVDGSDRVFCGQYQSGSNNVSVSIPESGYGSELRAYWDVNGYVCSRNVDLISEVEHLYLQSNEPETNRQSGSITLCSSTGNVFQIPDPYKYFDGQDSFKLSWVNPPERLIAIDGDTNTPKYVHYDSSTTWPITMNLTMLATNGEPTTNSVLTVPVLQIAMTHSNAPPCAAGLNLDHWVDLDIQDGTAPMNTNDSSEADMPGKVVAVNNNDDDADGIPDFIDGFNWNEQGSNYISCTNEDAFVPVLITIPQAVNVSDMKLLLTLSGNLTSSIPWDATLTAPAEGNIRLWRKAGNEARTTNDYIDIPTNGAYFACATNLGVWTNNQIYLYLEGVNSGSGALSVAVGPSDYEGYFWTDTVAVTVIKVDMEIYKPKVIDPAETMIPDASEMTTGSVTFVNLDNDDNDSKFDYDGAGTHDDIVVGGDDELVKVKLKIQPNNLAQGQVKLLATAGAANVAVWTNNEKSASSAYTLGTALNVPGDLTVEGDSLVKTLWVEGVSAHTVQKGTTLKMEYTVGGTTCDDEAALTVVGVDQIAWQGKTNSVSDTNTLDADPNWPSGLTPNAVRVFPDARVVGGAVEANPRDRVITELTLTVEPPSEIKVYLDSFDVDDPTASTNVVDNETADEDNRGTSPAKAGQFTGESGGVKELVIPANVKTTNCEFQVTMQPGDNFRVVANGDQDFLATLENKDSIQNTGASDAEKNANKQRIVCTNITGTVSEKEIRLPGYCASDTLTVWRFLHVEVDSMGAPPTTGAEKNTVDGNITAITGNGTVAQTVTVDQNLDDGSKDLGDTPTENGRFETGWIKIGSGAGTPGETTTTNLLGNGDDYVRKDGGIDIPARVAKTGQGDIDGKVVAWSGSNFTLNVSAGVLSTNYNGGSLNVAGISMTVSTVSTNGGTNVVTVTATNNIPFVLHDDDITEEVPDPNTGGMDSTWKEGYITPLFDTGYNTTNAPFHLYTPITSFTTHANESKGSPNSESRYWVVMVKCGYQTDVTEDNDSNTEGTWRGAALGENVLLLEESIRDWIASPTNNPNGGGGGMDPDPTGDAGRQLRRQEIVNHEVGHLFDLIHDDGLPMASGRLNGDVMLPSWGPPGWRRQASYFGATSLDKIRKVSHPQ